MSPPLAMDGSWCERKSTILNRPLVHTLNSGYHGYLFQVIASLSLAKE